MRRGYYAPDPGRVLCFDNSVTIDEQELRRAWDVGDYHTVTTLAIERYGREIFSILKTSGYKGAVSVELEDENFNGTEEGEKRALEYSLAFLKSI